MERRSFLKRWFAWLFGVFLGIPLVSFWKSQRFRPPIEKRISKILKNGEFLLEPEFVLFDSEKGPVAISRTCTHLGCKVNFLEEESMFLCPCHQSKFDKMGRYISGPAKKDLVRFKVSRLEDGQGYLVYIPR